MSGIIALHGGGEFLAGDEQFLTALLRAAATSPGSSELHVAIVPTATARGRPQAAIAMGRAAFERVARDNEMVVRIDDVPIVDASSAVDPALIARLNVAHVIHLPGGDPDLIPTIVRSTPTEIALREALARGAVLAGASAGAMALGTWTWAEPRGLPGLGLVHLAVAPHVDDDAAAERWLGRLLASGVPDDVPVLGIAERTGVIGRAGQPWRVMGPGSARWRPVGSATWQVAHDGEELDLNG